MDFIKDTFLKLTEYTIPHGKETTLEKYLPSGIQKDSIGNYFIEIGNSETLFTTHLDTYCKKYEKVNHIIDGDIIKTDGTTILGGDNKLGCTILLYMISKNIPGLYYFFLSEEPISPKGGRWGSQEALKSYESLFKKYKRCVAFDRKQKGSIVTRQLGRTCCSEEFANTLAIELGMDYKSDHKAYYTDTATFLDIIPECTNISAGGWNEHYTSEWVDLSYTRKVAEAACGVDWENLPTKRLVEDFSPKKLSKFDRFDIEDGLVEDIETMLHDNYDLLWTNKRRWEAHIDSFLLFNGWFEDSNLKVTPGKVIVYQFEDDEQRFQDVKEFDLYLNDVFGVPLDYSPLNIDDNGFINLTIKGSDYQFNIEDYLKLFDKINPKNTSYIAPGMDQLRDHSGELITKDQFYKWLKQQGVIE
jgi:hypothetical protein